MASKATGYPIAKVAAKISIGYNLPEIEIKTLECSLPAAFEPVIDYVAVKIPYFNFNKFPEADATLSISMKAVGEVMALGRTFKEALQKALDSLDLGHSIKDMQRSKHGDAWFSQLIEELIECEGQISRTPFREVTSPQMLAWKQQGFSDSRLGQLLGVAESQVWKARHLLSVLPTYKCVDSCAGEFATRRAIFYSTFENACEANPTNREKIIVLGGGPNRIGQGIEFDYCCVHAILAIRSCGYEAIMINCNPSTVSTDDDISDRLYFEPLTVEKIHEIILKEHPKGIIVQFGGQTPLDVGRQLDLRGVDILGTPFWAIDCAEDRAKFRNLLLKLGFSQPRNSVFANCEGALHAAQKIGYPIIVRPSYVIGGKAICIIEDEAALQAYLSRHPPNDAPVLIEEFLAGGVEVEIDAICDGSEVFICGILENIDPVGIHSGDSICSLSPIKLARSVQDQMKHIARQLGLHLQIQGLYNVQFAVLGTDIFVLEVNPRASRTVPLLSKITGLPLVQLATKCILGHPLDKRYTGEAIPLRFAVKVPVFPFDKLAGANQRLGPQMKSTGEALGLGETFEEAFHKVGTHLANSIQLSPAGKQLLEQISPAPAYSIFPLQID